MLESIRTAYRGTVFGIFGYNYFTKSGFVKAAKSFDPSALDVDLSGTTFLVTGANSGLGKITSKELARRGARVLMVCRNEAAATAAKDEIVNATANNNITLLLADISDPIQIKALADKIIATKQPVDVLINNAGALYADRSTTSAGLDSNFATNTLGAYYLTELLVPVLRQSKDPRVVTVSSGGAYNKGLDADDVECKTMKPWDGTVAYAFSKRAQIEMTNHWSAKYPNISFYSMHPGWSDTPGVQTSLPAFHKMLNDKLRTQEQGSDSIVWCAVSKAVKEIPNGSFVFDRALAKQHLTLACTETTPETLAKFIQVCDDHIMTAVTGAA